jgi:hypothetical protein
MSRSANDAGVLADCLTTPSHHGARHQKRHDFRACASRRNAFAWQRTRQSRSSRAPKTCSGSRHHASDRVDVIVLDGVSGNPVGAQDAAPGAAVNDHQALARAGVNPLGPHRRAAAGRPVAGNDVDVPGPQAARTVVAVTPVRQRHHLGAAGRAREALILGSPADGSASGSKKRSSIGSAGFRSVLTGGGLSGPGRTAPRLGAGDGPIHRPFPLIRGRRLLPLPASPGRISSRGSVTTTGFAVLDRSLSAEPPRLPAVGVIPPALAVALVPCCQSSATPCRLTSPPPRPAASRGRSQHGR